ncbi:hypothetical protein BDR05DRAFT_1002804 [Suillus weaverae]|nr:hypothetical protein BDR05DRAFT_1002804 [Suillus weaverae]
MGYMKDILKVFLTDAKASGNPLKSDFRSTALDYYLWLDHKSDGFDDGSHVCLKKEWNMTLEALKNGDYHKARYNDHDFCGAFQGCNEGEDIQSLLIAIDALMDELDMPNNMADGTPVNSVDVVHPYDQASGISACLCFYSGWSPMG